MRATMPAALAVQDRLTPLHAAMFVDPNPAGPKYACSLLGRMANEVRLPMLTAVEAAKRGVRGAMAHAGLLNA